MPKDERRKPPGSVTLDATLIRKMDTPELCRRIGLGRFILDKMAGEEDPRWPGAKAELERQVATLYRHLEQRDDWDGEEPALAVKIENATGKGPHNGEKPPPVVVGMQSIKMSGKVQG